MKRGEAVALVFLHRLNHSSLKGMGVMAYLFPSPTEPQQTRRAGRMEFSAIGGRFDRL